MELCSSGSFVAHCRKVRGGWHKRGGLRKLTVWCRSWRRSSPESSHFPLPKLQMKIEKGGGGGIQYRSVTGVPWSRPQPNGQPPYDLKFMMTGPQADFWFPVTARTASYTGQWYSENTMQGILAYRGQVTQAL